MYEHFAYMCQGHHVYEIGSHKRVLDPLEMESQVAVSHHVGAGD